MYNCRRISFMSCRAWGRIVLNFTVFALMGIMFFLPSAVTASDAVVSGVEAKSELRPEKWTVNGKNVSKGKLTLPPLPMALSDAGVGEFNGELYVIGGVNQDTGKLSAELWSIPLEDEPGRTWKRHPDLPYPVKSPLIQSFYNEIVIIGGVNEKGELLNTVYSYSPIPREGHEKAGYIKHEDCPEKISGEIAPVVRTGQSHLLTAVGKQLLLFHNLTSRWLPCGMLDCEVPGAFFRPGDNEREWILDNGKIARKVFFDNSNELLPFWDYLVIGLYFVVVALVGMFFAKRQKNANDFALGGQRIKWWAAGISMMASGVSAISFMAIPAMIASTSLVFTAGIIFMLPGMLVAAYVTYPLFRRLNITSTFEYLENRYGLILRLAGSFLAISFQIFARMSVVILLPAIAVSAMTGISVGVCVLLIGGVTTLYSSAGGFEAVIWTDVVQGILIIVGFIAVGVIAYFNVPGGIDGIMEAGRAGDKFVLFMTGFDFSLPVVWISIIGMVLGWMTFASDQTIAQRISCTPLKDVRKLSYIYTILGVLVALMSGAIGVMLFAYFRSSPEMLDPVMVNDNMVPIFILKRVPVGITGIIIATLFAASMSTISTSVNTAAVLFGEDFIKRFCKKLTSKQELYFMQGMSLFSGLFGTAMAYYLISAKTPAIQQLNVELGALFGGGFAGVFALGMFTRRTHELGAIIGIIAGAVVPLLLKFYLVGVLHWSVWGIVSTLSCMVIGYLASLIIPWKHRDLRGLTIFDQIPDKGEQPAQ